MQAIAAGIADYGIQQRRAVEAKPARCIAVTAAEAECRAAQPEFAIIKAVGENKIALIFRSEPDGKNA